VKTMTVFEARNNFSRTLDAARKDVVVVTRNGVLQEHVGALARAGDPTPSASGPDGRHALADPAHLRTARVVSCSPRWCSQGFLA